MSRRPDSENEDDPEPFQSSGDEWDVEEAKKQENSRRKSTRISKKTKTPVVEDSASDFEEDGDLSEDDFFSEEEPTNKKKNIAGKRNAKPPRTYSKKKKVSNDSELSNDANSNMSQEDKKDVTASDSDSSRTSTTNTSRSVHRKFIPKTIFSEDYAAGSFVILKKDAQGCDPSKHPVIWRIDGKSLLQKYEAFEEDGVTRHKNTSIYTGWSPLDKDLYAPITVDVVRHSHTNLIVEVLWDKLKNINTDSD